MSELGTFITLPREVLELEGLEWPAKIVWGEVHAFSRQGRPCWLSLAELGRRCQRSPRQVSAYIKQLSSTGLLRVEAVDGRRRHLRAYMPDPCSPPLPTKPTSTTPASTVEVSDVPATRPTATLTRDPLPTNKKQEQENGEEKTNRGRAQSLEAVREYFTEIGGPNEAEQFWDYWTSAGWRRKSGPLKDWRAAARTWMRQPYRGGDRTGRQLDAGAALEWAGK